MEARKRTVLVVDDDDDVREVAVALLEAFGFATLEAGNGDEALRMLGGLIRIDLLFSDVLMPGMNGFELAKSAIRLCPDLRVLLTTGFCTQDLADAMSNDGYKVLAKPYKPKALLCAVQAEFERRPLPEPPAEPTVAASGAEPDEVRVAEIGRRSSQGNSAGRRS